jgi:hypothetical protein
VLQGRLDEAERLAGEALALGRRAHDLVVAIDHMIVLIGLRWGQGRLPELETTLRRFVHTTWAGVAALVRVRRDRQLRRMVSFRPGGDVESRGKREHLLDASAGKSFLFSGRAAGQNCRLQWPALGR